MNFEDKDASRPEIKLEVITQRKCGRLSLAMVMFHTRGEVYDLNGGSIRYLALGPNVLCYRKDGHVGHVLRQGKREALRHARSLEPSDSKPRCGGIILLQLGALEQESWRSSFAAHKIDYRQVR